jgi:hypothetical protein
MNMKMLAAAIGVALFAWTVASVGISTLASQMDQLGVMVPFVMALAAVRFALQTAGWRLAMESSQRPGLLHAFRAVIAGEAAGYLTWGPLSREPVKALMVREHTPERVSLAAAIVERIAYMWAATTLVAISLILVAVRANHAQWIVPALVIAIALVALSKVLRQRFGNWLPQSGRASRSLFAALATLAILQEMINVFETYVVLTWLGAAPTIEAAVALEGLNRLANAPAQLIPGKLGILELAGSAFAGALQLGTSNGLTLVLARRVRSLAWTGVGILLLTASASRIPTAEREPVIIS